MPSIGGFPFVPLGLYEEPPPDLLVGVLSKRIARNKLTEADAWINQRLIDAGMCYRNLGILEGP